MYGIRTDNLVDNLCSPDICDLERLQIAEQIIDRMIEDLPLPLRLAMAAGITEN